MPAGPPQEHGVYTFSEGKLVQRHPRRPPRRRWPRRLLIGTLVFALVIVAAGWGIVRHLEGNIHTVTLSEHSASIDAANGKPLDVLVLGSDSRASAEDCKIGGDCPHTGTPVNKADAMNGNADVEMLIHLSADRKHAEIVSIPRDTVVPIPDCRSSTGDVPAHRGRINSSMEQGPDCTVRTVEQLTGVTIPHVAVVDFQGVITMTNALGGVPVCVDNNVYDPYSHLKLTKGTHTVQGKSALEFVRTRHGFGDGGDVGRTGAQHIFLGSMIRTLRSASTLADPVTLYDVADAATKALTVDKGLAGASNLSAFYSQLDKVPTKNITFVTMPNEPDPLNSAALIPAPAATALFQRLVADTFDDKRESDTTPSAKSPSSGAPSGGSSNKPNASGSSGAGDAAAPQQQATESSCAHVSTANTVTVNGQVMDPIQAFSASKDVPLSAK